MKTTSFVAFALFASVFAAPIPTEISDAIATITNPIIAAGNEFVGNGVGNGEGNGVGNVSNGLNNNSNSGGNDNGIGNGNTANILTGGLVKKQYGADEPETETPADSGSPSDTITHAIGTITNPSVLTHNPFVGNGVGNGKGNGVGNGSNNLNGNSNSGLNDNGIANGNTINLV